MIDNKAVGKAIAALRIQKKMTQQDLAAKVSVSHQAVSKWESGAALPDTQTLLNLSRLFQITVDELLRGEVPKDKSESTSPIPPFAARQPEPISEAGAPQVDTPKNDSTDQTIRAQLERKLNTLGDRLTPNIQRQRVDFRVQKAEPFAQPSAQAEEAEYAAPEETETLGDRLALDAERQNMALNDRINEQINAWIDREFVSQHAGGERSDANAAAEQPEEQPQEEQPQEEQSQEESSPNWALLRRLAPFMSASALGNLAMKYADQGNLDQLLTIVPFLNRETLERLLKRYEEQVNLNAIVKLAPFISSESLFSLIKRLNHALDLDTITKLAPFLNHRMVDALVFSEESGWGKTEPACESSSEPSFDARPIHYSRDEIMPSQIVRSAVEEGEFDFLSEHAAQLAPGDLSYAAITAADQGNFDFLEEISARLGEGDLEYAANSAAEQGEFDFIRDIASRMSDKILSRVAAAAAEQGEFDFIRDIASRMGDKILSQVALTAAEQGEFDFICTIASRMSSKALEPAAMIAAEQDEFDFICTIASRLDGRVLDAIALSAMEQEETDFVQSIVSRLSEKALKTVTIIAIESEQCAFAEAIFDRLIQLDRKAVRSIAETASEQGEFDLARRLMSAISQ